MLFRSGAGGRTRTDTLFPAADFESVFEIVHGRACNGIIFKNSSLWLSTIRMYRIGRAYFATNLRPLWPTVPIFKLYPFPTKTKRLRVHEVTMLQHIRCIFLKNQLSVIFASYAM